MNKKLNNFNLCIDPPCFILNKITKIKCDEVKCTLYGYFNMIYMENKDQYEKTIYGKILTSPLIPTISRSIVNSFSYDSIKKDNVTIIKNDL